MCKACCWGAEGAQKQRLVEVWAQLEAARDDAEEQKRQLATAQVSTWPMSILVASRVTHLPLRDPGQSHLLALSGLGCAHATTEL